METRMFRFAKPSTFQYLEVSQEFLMEKKLISPCNKTLLIDIALTEIIIDSDFFQGKDCQQPISN